MVDMRAHLLLGCKFPSLLLFKYIYFETALSHFGEEEGQIKFYS